MGKFNKFLMLAVCVLLNGTGMTQKALAEEYIPEKSGLDVIFVMDYSGSMRANDPERIAQGMVKAFIDTVHPENIRIGFVAYNDRLLSAEEPLSVETNEKRQQLKARIDEAAYSGNTDIGLGLRYAYEQISREERRRRILVLISDGESDLKGSVTGRGLENALEDMEYVTSKCEKENIPVYSIAFGEYDGSARLLEHISARTGGRMYSVKEPEALIEVLYGIFGNNMDYCIEKITDGTYASGKQDILVKLDKPYVDELDVLLISPQNIGEVKVMYGGSLAETLNLKNYAVTKITNVDPRTKELVVETSTAKDQELQVYLIAYRNLIPVLQIEVSANKNSPLAYQVYFKDGAGNIIEDESFYKNFSCEFTLSDENGEKEKPDTKISNGRLFGEIIPKRSGSYFLDGKLEDSMGRAVFPTAEIRIQNRRPVGELPAGRKYTALSKKQKIVLDDCFSDPDSDVIQYSLKKEGTGGNIELCGRELVFKPTKSGAQTIRLDVSDGEDIYEYSYTIEVIPLWQAFWWVIAIGLLVAGAAVGRWIRKPVPELEKLEAETKKNHFAGQLDAYFTVQPETEEEIPPLSFPMYKIKENKLCLGSLLGEYSQACRKLGLDEIFLVADEERRMILYHTSEALVMAGNSILCRSIRYSINFGDIIYITSEDRTYDLEIHYVGVIR